MRPPIDDATQALVVCCVVQQAVSRVWDFFDKFATRALDEDQRVRTNLWRCLQVSGGAMMARDSDRPLFGRQSKVMTVEEVSEYLHVHPSTIYRLIKRRKIPAFRIGSDWRFNIETIDKWRSEMEAGAPDPHKKT
jgi:excisionase family DNA binding protein